MASLGDLTLFISAETDRAQKDIDGLGKSADRVVGKKREIGFDLSKARNSIRDFKRDLESVGKAAKIAFQVAKTEAFFDDEIESVETLGRKVKQIGPALNNARKPGQLLARTFDGIGRSTMGVVSGLAKIGFALYGIKQITGVLQAAFGGFFKATLGQNIQLHEQILKTQTALASTNDVFKDGKIVSDPLKAIEALTGAIEDRIESIRERSLDLAGVTSSQVIEVFGITAQQIGQIGGSLKDAEDLAISFSAALGTFGIPLYQARQEVGSILRGDITQDSYLAKALGITPDDVKKAKNSTEGLVKFLETKLEAAVAGQAIAAKSFSGVVSNLADFQELIGQRFGAPLLDPLLGALNKLYALLTSVKEEAFGAAEALGSGIGKAASFIGGQTTTDAKSASGKGALGNAGGQVENEIRSVGAQIAGLGAQLQQVFSNVFLLAAKAAAAVGKGIKELTGAFVGLNVGIFKSLLNTFEILLGVTQGLFVAAGDLLGVYADFLSTPIIGFFAELGAQYKLLESLGVGAIVKLGLVFGVLVKSWKTVVGFIVRTVKLIQGTFASASAFVAKSLQVLAQSVAAFATKLGATVPAAKALSIQLNSMAASANAASVSMKKASASNNMLATSLKNTAKGAIVFELRMMAIMALLALAIKLWGEYKRSQEAAFKANQADDAYTSLITDLATVTEASSDARQAQRDLALSILDSQLAVDKKAWVDASSEVDKYTKSLAKATRELEEYNKRSKGPLDMIGLGTFQDTTFFEAFGLELAEKELVKATAAFEKRMAEVKEANRVLNLDKEVKTRSKALGQVNERLQKQQVALNRRVTQDRFNAEMELHQARVEYSRSLAQEEIELMSNRHKLLVEGEEGASAAALAGLADYAKSRAETEANIESKRQQRAIAMQRLEKEIDNYKFDINNKVLEMRKLGAKVDQAAADYVQKVYEKILQDRKHVNKVEAETSGKEVPVVYGDPRARVGSTDGNSGHSTGPHLDIRNSDRQAVLRDALDLIKVWQQEGVKYIQLSNIGKDITNITDEQMLKKLILQEIEAHGSRKRSPTRKGMYAADIAVPRGTPIMGAGNITEHQQGKAGYMAQLASGSDLLHLMDPKKVEVPTKALAESMQQEVKTPDLAPYESAKRGLLETNRVLDESKQRLQEIAAGRQLEAVLDQLAPKAVVEQYDDAIIKAENLAEVLRGNNKVTLDQAKIIAEMDARKDIARRELAQYEAAAGKEFFEDEVKRNEHIENARERLRVRIEGDKEKNIKGWNDELEARLKALAIAKETAAIEALAVDARANKLRTDQSLIMGQAQMGAGLTTDKFKQAEIMAQGQIGARYAKMESEGAFSGDNADKAHEDFAKFSETTLFNAERQAEMDGMMERFQQIGEIASGAGTAISTAFTQGFADILSGAKSVQDVLGNMFQGIADSFMQMATKIIADMIKMMILKTLLGLFGGGSMPGGGLGNMGGGGGAGGGGLNLDGMKAYSGGGGGDLTSWLPKFAKGGVVNGPTPALIGEGGQSEAVVPLPNGKAIPVDFGKKGAGGNVQTNITVNVDQSGSTETQMEGDSANKLGQAIDGAVKRVIMEERRSGGLLHNGRR